MLKQLARLAAYRSGAIELVRRLNQNRVRILMYHRFARQHATNFDRQCAYLAAKYNVVTFEEAVERLKLNAPVSNMAVITIDDGYADAHEVAFPILRRHRLPATLFITTGFIKRTCWMPGDRVRYHFAQTTAETVKVTDHEGRVHTFRTSDTHAADEFRALLKRVPESAKRRMLAELDGDRPVPNGASVPDEYRPCTWEQLRELADGGVSIGAHTVTHPILSRLEAAADTEQEIVQSKVEIEEEVRRPVAAFAYPNGLREDIDQVSVDCARTHFKGAVTAVSGLNAPGGDLHELFRLPCDASLSLPQMARLLAGPVGRSSAEQHLRNAA